MLEKKASQEMSIFNLLSKLIFQKKETKKGSQFNLTAFFSYCLDPFFLDP